MTNRYAKSMRTTRRAGRTRRGAALALVAAAPLLAATGAEAAAKKIPETVAPRLEAFSSCKALLSFAHAGALKTQGTPGVPLRAGGGDLAIASPPAPTARPATTEGTVAPTAVPTAAAPASGTTADTSEPTFSTTNNQEDGVDEPDVVKTDGHFVYLVTDRTLRIVDVTLSTPSIVGSLPLKGYGQQLLLRGGRLLVSASAGGYGYPVATSGGTVVRQVPQAALIAPRPGYGQTLLTEVDISDRAHPKVARAMTIDGDYVGARLNGGTARVVIGSAPDPIVAQDGETFSRAVRDTGVGRFIPKTVLKSSISGRTFRRPIARCGQVRRPRSFSGTGLLTVMTIDLDRGLYSVDRDAVMAGAQTVYGSAGSLYIASQRYDAALEDGQSIPSGSVTEIHRFDASKDGVTTYRSSGQVPGFVLNQYAMSEDDGKLRVATTQEPTWFEGSLSGEDSSSAVTVLDEQAGRLVPVGRVGDLGKGERIYAVRFVGPAAYVVTFRQVDPLYVIDLSDPTAPKVRGELKIAGYSAYLHPLGDDLLLGVGQDATDAGRRTGAQVSLFDVSDPAAPKRLSQKLLGDGSSAAEFDPHAFLYWAPTKLAALPLSGYDQQANRAVEQVVGFHVDRAGGITDAGRVEHPDGRDANYDAPIDRSLVIRGKLYTLSYAGLGRSSLDTLSSETFTPFPLPAANPRPVPEAGTTVSPAP